MFQHCFPQAREFLFYIPSFFIETFKSNLCEECSNCPLIDRLFDLATLKESKSPTKEENSINKRTYPSLFIYFDNIKNQINTNIFKAKFVKN